MDSRRIVRLAALLVAGGRGSRFGSEDPKQFLLLGGRPLFEHAARALHQSSVVDTLYVVSTPGWEDRLRHHLETAGLAGKLGGVVAGGATRQDSVGRGLEAVGAFTHILVHDAARPFVTEALVLAALGAAVRHGAATVGLPISDTLFRAEVDMDEPRSEPQATHAVAPVGRDGLWSVQTPQAFELELLREAHRHARSRGLEATDDGRLVLELGHRLDLVPGHWWNIKVTRPEDLVRAEMLLSFRDRWLAMEEPA
jgi:2-C-methyl-D-erythritol 4-phosphate cytidylyltransferase